MPEISVAAMNFLPAGSDRNAVLLWESPVWGVNADIVARAVVGKRDTYYVIAIRVAPSAPNEEKVNQQLRTMLESFRPL